jgi:hypothetical protein
MSQIAAIHADLIRQAVDVKLRLRCIDATLPTFPREIFDLVSSITSALWESEAQYTIELMEESSSIQSKLDAMEARHRSTLTEIHRRRD